MALYEKIYVHGLPMKPVGIVLGLLLILAHGIALLRPAATQRFLKSFPRNKAIGVALLVIATAWTWFLVRHMDMGEFFTWRQRLLLVVPIGAVLMALFADEFLSVRALGCLLLLTAAVVLRSAFLKDPWIPKLLLPILSYVWVICGLFWVGMPYLMRDGIYWITQNAGRLKIASWLGLVYGLVLIGVAATQYTT